MILIPVRRRLRRMTRHARMACRASLLASTVAALSPATVPAQAVPDTIVRTAGAARHAGVATLRQELSIGTASGAAEYMFGDVHDVAVAADGAIYVMDRSINSVRMYDSTGRFVRTIGRRGQGPGEIATASGMVVLPDRRLLVYDTGNRRINVYSATGDHVTQWALPVTSTSLGRNLAWDSAGFVHARTVGRTSVSRTRVLSVESIWIRLRASDGAIVDTVPEPQWPPYTEPLIATRAGTGRAQMAMPFTPGRYVAISPRGYMVTGLADRYAFELRAAGKGVISIRRNVPATPVSADERRTTRERIETHLREVDPRWSWGTRDIPRVKPLYQGIAVGSDGRIWITREQSPRPARPRSGAGRSGGGVAPAGSVEGDDVVERPSLFDVFEPDGTYLGAVQAPARVTLLAMSGDRVWGVARDDDDVESVRRWRISWR